MSRKSFRNLIAYEIYPTSFRDSNADGIGDLRGITEKLDYVRNMGFNAIWLNPFYVSPFRDGGYDVMDFFDVDPRFGTLRDFQQLCRNAHEKGIKILVDLVAGHASSDNRDFLESARPEKNEKSDLFIWNDNVWNLEPGLRLISGMHQRNGCYLVNFFAHQPAFNYGFKRIDYPSWQMSYKDERTFRARNYMLEVMRFWLGKGADGFRVDMADSLVKNDDDKKATCEVWRWMFRHIRKEYPGAFFVSEWSNPKQAFEAGFDADFVLDHWDNYYHRTFRSNYSTRGKAMIKGGGDIRFALKDMRERFDEAFRQKKQLALITGNHDTWRIANYLNEDELRTFYLMLFTLPGVPFVLYGDEIGMKTADLVSKDGGFQRTGTRIPMIWNDSEPYHGFSQTAGETYLPFNPDNEVSAEAAMADDDSLYHFIRKLIELRKKTPDLSDPAMEIIEKDRIVTFTRGKYRLIVNMSEHEFPFEGKVVFSSGDYGNTLPAGAAVLVR